MEEDMMSPEEIEAYMEMDMDGAAASVNMDPATAATVAGMGLFGALLGLVVLVATIAGWWKVFTKAKQPGWAAIIPVYNMYILFKIVKLSPMFLLILIGFFIPIVNFFAAIAWFVVVIIAYHRLSLTFGKGLGFTIGLVLLNPIFMIILGFGDAEFKESMGGVDDENRSDGPRNPQQPINTNTMSSSDME